MPTATRKSSAPSLEDQDLRTELVRDEAWRLSIATYAATASHWRKRWVPYRWLRYVSTVIQEELRQGNARIILNAPPRHGKSEFISHWLPVWFLDWFPDRKVIAACYGDSLASDWGRMVRDELLMNSACWTQVRRDTQAVNDWRTTEGGGMRTAGVGGPLTGKGGDLIIVDDPHKNWEDAMSPIARQRLLDWFNAVLYTRLEPDASMLIVQTRWHEEDLTGYLLNEHEDKWRHINLPALAEDNDPLGRELGQALCPQRFDRTALLKIKAAIREQMFAGIYQQRPAPAEGAIIHRDQFNYYDERPSDLEHVVLSFDLTFDSDGTSFTVGQVWGRRGPDFYLLDQERDRWDFDGQISLIGRMRRAWASAEATLIEKKANGAAAIKTVRKSFPAVIPINPTSSKEVRLMSVQPLFKGGNVYVPSKSRASWVGDYVEEMVTFPRAKNDDQVDATTQALLWYQGRAVPEADAPDLDPASLLGGARESEWRF